MRLRVKPALLLTQHIMHCLLPQHAAVHRHRLAQYFHILLSDLRLLHRNFLSSCRIDFFRLVLLAIFVITASAIAVSLHGADAVASAIASPHLLVRVVRTDASSQYLQVFESQNLHVERKPFPVSTDAR